MSASAFPAILNLATLALAQGVVYSTNAGSGAEATVVAGAGDVNGDGYDDFLVGAPFGQPNFASLILGQAGGWSNLNLQTATVPAAYDFTRANSSRTGFAVAGAGDMNGDGLADFVVTASAASASGRLFNGVGYVVFGKTTGWSDIDLTTLNGGSSGGYQISGPSDFVGIGAQAAKSLGDVNGDGFADIYLSGDKADGAGFGYIIYGKAGGVNNANIGNLDLATATTTQAVRVTGPTPMSYNLMEIAGAGDINGDGFADFALGNLGQNVGGLSRAGTAFIGFGGAALGNVNFNSAIPAGAGFRITGGRNDANLGSAINSAGDVNGDGITDLLVGGSQATYLIFGHAGAWTDLNVGTMAASAGVTFTGSANSFGGAVSAAGDLNGDGYGDLLISAYQADVNGLTSAGAVYVVYGKASGWTNVNFDNTPPGALIQGAVTDGYLGYQRDLVALGDIDGDGFGDIGVGSLAGPSHDGTVYALFSQASGTVTSFGTTLADSLHGGAASDTLAGGAGRDTLSGGAGDDRIDGGAGNDLLNGGAGSDTASYAGAAASVTVSLLLTAPQATGGAGTDTLIGFENLTGSGFDDTLSGDNNDNLLQGGAGNDTVLGLAGNDTIEGGAGDDTADGGAGSDTASYAGATAVTVSLLLQGSGQNTGSAGTDTLFNFENLAGGAGNDTLTGDAGDNIIQGGAGNDLLNGGAGLDTASYASATANVTLSLLAQGTAYITLGAGTDTLSNFENLIGGVGNDTIVGDTGPNVMEGGAGNDLMNAGTGTDTASYAGATAGVYVSLLLQGAAQNTQGAGTDTLTSFENLLGSAFDDTLGGDTFANILTGGAGRDLLFGEANDDTLLGGAGNDILYGGAGNDSMSGGTGDDQYVIESLGDSVFENAGEGFDTVFVTIAGWAAAPNIEATYLYGSVTVQLGSASGDVLIGNVSNSASSLDGSGGDDVLWGNGGNDTLTGGLGNDVLRGLAGNDSLIGGAGNDQLVGGTGADSFVFGQANWGYDQIFDFSRAEGDRIDMRGSGVTSLAGFDSVLVIGASTALLLGAARIDVYGVANLQASDFLFS